MNFATETEVMRHALVLAARGVGHVEPNPPVGAVIVDEALQLLGEGWHQRFGGPHAEVFALQAAGERARGQTLFVTLEPCCHFGKTPPCSRAVIAAGIRRVVISEPDPARHVNGGGIAELRAAGIIVEIGLLEDHARRLTAPFVKLMTRGRPWVHAKWAMTLDGKIATHRGHSQWISGPESREVAHELRGRMDAIVVGIGTVLADDPQLTARPPGPRTATRIVIDSRARLPLTSKLVRTARDASVICFTTESAPADRVELLRAAGVEVISLPGDDRRQVPVTSWLDELGRRQQTNVLVEGGGRLLGSLFDAQEIDEVHAYIAPKLVGGDAAISPLSGTGLPFVPELGLIDRAVRLLGDDVYVHGRVRRPCTSEPR